MRRLIETIEVKQNIEIIARERGKIVARREGHNIWLNTGRGYLADLISLISYNPDNPLQDNRIKYMGLGIGGAQQLAVNAVANPPLSTGYPGPNAQTDVDPDLIRLERPVRISGGSLTYPGNIGVDVWLGQVVAPPDQPTSTEVKFARTFILDEISYAPYLSVPLSEIGLFHAGSDPLIYNNIMLAYDTFDTISKTAAFELQVLWTIRF